MKLKLGLGQLLVEGGEPERNMERALNMIEDAAKQNCDIILLPETFDFAWTHPSGLTEAEPIPGKYSDLICEAAKNSNIYICCGLTEKKSDGNYNTAILIDNKGEILIKYHKQNLLDVEKPFYKKGNELFVVDSPFGKIGVNICADNYLDSVEIGKKLGDMGAKLILSPSSWTVDYSITEADDPYKEKWNKPYDIIAKHGNLIIAGTTCVGYIVGGPYEGKKSVGCSLVSGISGILAQGTFNEFASELIILDLEL